MKKTVWPVLLVLVFGGCGGGGAEVEKHIEDGVEVVVSGLEPYRLPDAPRNLHLEEALIIDLEDEAVSAAGLYQIDTFAVGGGGDLYIVNTQAELDHIYTFNSDGSFSGCFGRHGQGPGELMRPNSATFTPEGELLVTDPDNAKLVYFREDGSLIRETILDRNIPYAHPLPGGRFVVFGRITPDPEAEELEYPLDLCDAALNPLQPLDRFRLENFRISRRIRGTQPGFGLAVGGGRIFVGNEARDYEIWVFDGDGTLTRKIRKQYRPLPVSDEIKQKALARYNDRMRPFVFFPENLPPFRTMTADERDTLYVVTFEAGDVPGENRIDVFDPDGAYIGRLSAAVLANVNTAIYTTVRGGRFYYIREKDSGYKQLVAERIVSE